MKEDIYLFMVYLMALSLYLTICSETTFKVLYVSSGFEHQTVRNPKQRKFKTESIDMGSLKQNTECGTSIN